jgi:hypothetical protein
MNHEQLAELAGIPSATLRGYVHKAVFRPEQAGAWTLPEALVLMLFVAFLRDGASADKARADAISVTTLLGGFIRRAMGNQAPETGASRLVYVKALVPSERIEDAAEDLERLITADDDMTRLLGVLARRRALLIEARDVTAVYLRVLEAFGRIRSAQRERVPA